MKRRSVLALLFAVPAAHAASSVLANPAQQMLLAGGAAAPVWTAGGSLATARSRHSTAGNSTSAVLAFNGFNTSSANISAAELYNGATWSAAAANPATSGNNRAGGGTSTDAMVAGFTTSQTQSFDATTWTNEGTLPDGHNEIRGCGTGRTAFLACGGTLNVNGITNSETYTYNGSSWSTLAIMITARHSHGCAGTTSAAMVCGGITGAANPRIASTELWNGSSWSSSGAMPANRGRHACSGISTGAVAAGGGDNTPLSSALTFASGVWTATANSMSTAREYPSAQGNSGASTLVVAGGTTTNANTGLASTELFA